MSPSTSLRTCALAFFSSTAAAAMRRRSIGAGLVVSEACLGTMTFGEQNDDAESFALLERALERGVNFM